MKKKMIGIPVTRLYRGMVQVEASLDVSGVDSITSAAIISYVNRVPSLIKWIVIPHLDS